MKKAWSVLRLSRLLLWAIAFGAVFAGGFCVARLFADCSHPDSFVALDRLAGSIARLEHFAWPIVAVIIAALFADPVDDLLRRIRSFKYGELGVDTSLQRAYEGIQLEAEIQKKVGEVPGAGTATEDPGETPDLTEAHVVKALAKVPYFDPKDLELNAAVLRQLLMQRGIMTNRDLDSLMAAATARLQLETLYVNELGRDRERPLDPIGFAVYAPLLHAFRLSPMVIEAIRQALHASDEYRSRRR